MRSSTGRWVSGDDFFNRDGELSILESRIRDGNHIVMTGQRRMGKTSILQELGRRLEEKGWIFLFADVEGAISEEDVVTKIAEAVHRYQPLPRRAWNIVGRRSAELWRRVKQVSAGGFVVDEGVAEAVYDRLGIGIPQHVQSFFARLRDYALRHDRECITMEDVDAVYRTELLGPSGQNDLAHYEARLRDGVGDETRYGIAMEILAEAAVQGVFTPEARHHLETRYSKLPSNAPRQVIETLDVLVHDGYLESDTEGYRFASNLLRDWWRARFRDHYTPLTVASRTTSGEIDPK